MNKKYVRAALAFIGINMAMAFFGYAMATDSHLKRYFVFMPVLAVLAYLEVSAAVDEWIERRKNKTNES